MSPGRRGGNGVGGTAVMVERHGVALMIAGKYEVHSNKIEAPSLEALGSKYLLLVRTEGT